MGIPGLFKNCIQKYHNISGNKIIQTLIRDFIILKDSNSENKSTDNVDTKSEHYVRNGNNVRDENADVDTTDSSSDSSDNEEESIIKIPIKNRLFLDFNCAIYYVLKPEMKSYETLITHTLAYLDTLCSLIPNLELIYLALDGVPPRAKMEQQRSRRFHSVCKKKKAQKINENYGNNLDKTNYNFHLDTNMITPGTEFMQLLSKKIQEHFNNSELYKNINVIFSDGNQPGEGEHKLLKYIKENPSKNDENTIIYGLDGDLIMLSLVSQEKNLYLLRESAQYGGFAKEHEGHKYLFLNIDNLKISLLSEFQEYMAFDMDHRFFNRYIDDYIFLCFILGNDFVPKIHWFSLHEGGHDKLIGYYFEVHNNTEEFLVDREKDYINRIMLMDIFQMLSLNENQSIKKCLKKRSRSVIPVKDGMSERERQQLLVDFYPLQYLHIEKEIDPYNHNWVQRYYNICCKFDYNENNIKMITDSYIKTLVWNFKYYFHQTQDWEFYYPFHYSPTTYDIFSELEKISNMNLVMNYKFANNRPVHPQTLLLMVLPINSCNLMATDISNKLTQGNSNIDLYFPNKYNLNVAFHRYYYECSANIPKFDMKDVNKFMKSINLTDEEIERNGISKLFIKNKNI